MFAPEGYISARRLYLDFLEAAMEAMPTATFFASSEKSRKRQLSDQEDFDNYVDSSKAFVEYLSENAEILICTQSGAIFSVDPIILSIFRAKTRDGFPGLWVINIDTWCIECGRAENWLQAVSKEMHEVKHAFRARKLVGADITEFRNRLSYLWQDRWLAKLLVKSYSAFEGASIVINKNEIPDKSAIKNMVLTIGRHDC